MTQEMIAAPTAEQALAEALRRFGPSALLVGLDRAPGGVALRIGRDDPFDGAVAALGGDPAVLRQHAEGASDAERWTSLALRAAALVTGLDDICAGRAVVIVGPEASTARPALASALALTGDATRQQAALATFDDPPTLLLAMTLATSHAGWRPWIDAFADQADAILAVGADDGRPGGLLTAQLATGLPLAGRVVDSRFEAATHTTVPALVAAALRRRLS